MKYLSELIQKPGKASESLFLPGWNIPMDRKPKIHLLALGDVGGTLLTGLKTLGGGLIGEMWQNIKEKPFTGIGFGIASDVHEMNVQRDPLLGLPLGAPIEKGVLPVAVLEEVGLFGLGFVVAWLWSFLRYWIRGGVVPVSVGLTILLLNMGEATLFSPGGMGLLSLILIGWVVACGQRGAETPQRSGVSKAH